MESKNFVVYKSSAGSGKTYTLVREYIRLVLLSDDPRYFRHILAITFTNKASNEMKERVLQSLEILSCQPEDAGFDPDYLNDIMQVTGLDADTIRKRAGATLEQMLHHYTDLAISTIDKFVHRVVRTFARDLRIPVDFDVELDSEHLLTKAIDLLVTRAGNDPKVTQVLVEFSEQKARDDKNWHIEDDLHKFSRSLIREESEPYLKVLRDMTPEQLNQVRESVFDEVEQLEDAINAIGEEGLRVINESSIPDASFAGGSRGVVPYFKAIAAIDERKLIARPSIIDKAIESGKWYSGKATKDEQNQIDELGEHFLALCVKLDQFLDKHLDRYQLFKLISDHLYAMSVLHELDAVIREIKEEINVLLIADFNKTISNIVLNEPAPFIYERLGERYHHYLIDEFQDTSVMQWQNLLPLVENSLSTASFNLVVGDGKQAIYRWRGGEVEQFAQLPGIYEAGSSPYMAEKAFALGSNYEERVLDTNYRSQKAIVEFNNDLFHELSAELDLEYRSIYEGQKQEALASKPGGYVEARLLEFKDHVSPDEGYLEELVATIRKVKEDGFRLQDIAILVRARRTGVMITEYLIEEGIDVISSESLLLASSPEVNLIINFFELIRNPGNNQAKTAIVKYLTTYVLKDQHFHEVVKKYTKEVDHEHHISNLYLYDFLNDYNFDIKLWRLTRQPIYQSVEDLIRQFGLDKTPDAYLQFFLDAVHGYSTRFGNNVVEFLEWWDTQYLKLAVQVPEGTEAVQVMTIHKSKGLQFPVVIAPFVNWDIKKSKDSLWVKLEDEIEGLDVALIPARKDVENTSFGYLYREEQEKSRLDNLNMLYVAFTRAEERLYILSESVTSKNNIAQGFAEKLVQLKGWKPNDMKLVRGRPEPPQQRKSGADDTYVLKKMPTGNWKDKLAISLQAHKLWDEDAGTEAHSLRALTITALSQIEKATDIPNVLKTLHAQGLVTEDEQGQLNEKLNALASLTEPTSLFPDDARVQLGVDILGNDGDNFRPDRLILENGSATLIHYAHPKNEVKKRKEGIKILEALNNMDYSQVKGYLFNITEEKWTEIA